MITTNLKLPSLLLLSIIALCASCQKTTTEKRPNILFAISDDQSFEHTSINGCEFIKTPAFDRVAKEGILFTNCYSGSPGCAPSRSSIVTGRHHWQNEQSGQHASSWLKKYVPFVDLLSENGYATGRTGKGVSPFRYARSEEDSLWRATDAGGIEHSNITYDDSDEMPWADGISNTNYFENFKYFMDSVRGDDPFFFWYGAREPHRGFEKDSWKRFDKKLSDVKVPDFLPDNDVIRGDLLDYAVEIEWFDLHLQLMLEYLEEKGELENTIVIVTADNGMAFPRAKANGYEYGVHVPMAIRYPKDFPGGRQVTDAIGFADLAPTILELTETTREGMLPISGQSLVELLKADNGGDVSASKQYAYSGRERHSSSRYLNWGFPQRIISDGEYLFTWNVKPERWPAGAPQRLNPQDTTSLWPMYGIDESGEYMGNAAFTDIDDCPTKTYILEHYQDEEIKPFFDLALGKRPEFEFFNVEEDPYCLNNLAGNPDYKEIEERLRSQLMAELRKSEDPRVVGPNPEVFDSYIRYSQIRDFPKPDRLEGETVSQQ